MGLSNSKFFNRYLPLALSLVLLVGAGLIYAFLKTPPAPAEAAWYNTGGTWNYRKPITIDHSKVFGTSTLASFPMLFSVTDTDLKATSTGGKVGRADGGDILFTSADGTTKLDHEIERYNSSTGETIMWVEIPTLATTTDTSIFIYFGNYLASAQQNAAGVWDSNYKLVSHLGNGTTLSGTDSTGVNNGTVTSATAATGVVDGGGSFDGVGNDSVNYASGATLDNLFASSPNTGTLEFWLNRSATGFQYALCKDVDGTENSWAIAFNGPGGNHKLYFRNQFSGNAGTWKSTKQFTDTGSWYHVVISYNGNSSSNVPIMYLNTVVETLADITSPSGSASEDTTRSVLAGNDGGLAAPLNGLMDEIRISNSIRSPDWIKTEYTNQLTPSLFYAYGAVGQETRSTPGVKTRGGVNVRGGVKFR